MLLSSLLKNILNKPMFMGILLCNGGLQIQHLKRLSFMVLRFRKNTEIDRKV